MSEVAKASSPLVRMMSPAVYCRGGKNHPTIRGSCMNAPSQEVCVLAGMVSLDLVNKTHRRYQKRKASLPAVTVDF